MNQLVRTCIGTPFSEASMRLNLKLPVAPFRMPSPDGGTLLLKGYEGDCDNAACGGQPQPSCGCHADKKPSCGCTQKSEKTDKSDDKCDDKCKGYVKEKVLERFELVEYSGYEENGDGLTLVITKRGVQGTSKLNWCSGIEVTQLTDMNTTYHFTDITDGRWRVEVRDIRGNVISSEIHGHEKTIDTFGTMDVVDNGDGTTTVTFHPADGGADKTFDIGSGDTFATHGDTLSIDDDPVQGGEVEVTFADGSKKKFIDADQLCRLTPATTDRKVLFNERRFAPNDGDFPEITTDTIIKSGVIKRADVADWMPTCHNSLKLNAAAIWHFDALDDSSPIAEHEYLMWVVVRGAIEFIAGAGGSMEDKQLGDVAAYFLDVPFDENDEIIIEVHSNKMPASNLFEGQILGALVLCNGSTYQQIV